MKETQISNKFNQGIAVSSIEFRQDVEFYLQVVDPMINNEQATEYPDMFGNVWTKRNKPLEQDLTPEQKHLQRPTELKSGVNQYFTRNDSLEERLKTVREQIDNCKHL